MRSNKQAAPDSANHVSSRSSGFAETKNAIGIATHKLRHWKQSINLATSPFPKRARNRTMRSAGPSSLASKCVIRQVARTARTSRAQKAPRITQPLPALRDVSVRVQVIADLHGPGQ